MVDPLCAETRRRPTVYESGVDAWIIAMLLLSPLLLLVLGLWMLFTGNRGDALIFFVSAIATLLFTAIFIAPCRYTILRDAISFRCGIVCYQVPLSQIDSIEPSSTWRSGPALSMKRVVITTQKRQIVVSPRDRETFIDDLRGAVERSKKP